jgi:alkanesulfonate monooxygenase SsuD/methylene tetrahydromethanopterin reductase-like flavin-dependent oxidoreductase (luciferase family)
MRLGISIVGFDDPAGDLKRYGRLGPELAAVAAAAEAAGVGRLSVMDRYFQMEVLGGAESAMPDLAETVCVPPPVSAPHPEIMIGGGGEEKTLRLVAQYADACNLTSLPHAEVAHKLEVLRRHCADVDRDYARIRKTAPSGASGGALAEQEAESGDWGWRASALVSCVSSADRRGRRRGADPGPAPPVQDVRG